MDLKNLAFTEKYRPAKICDIVGEHKDKIKNYLNDFNSMPNLLFVSRVAGTGKTSTCKAIIKEAGVEALFLNASDDRGIDIIRGKIKDYARSMSMGGKRKAILLDETDNLTNDAQMALRTLMEEYSSNVVFLLTCNFEHKLIDPLKSRCVKIDLSKPDSEGIKNFLDGICKSENIETEEGALEKLINDNYPSIRDCVNILQDVKVSGKKLTKSEITRNPEIIKFMDLIKSKKYEDVRKMVYTGGIDVLKANRYLWDFINEDTNKMTSENKIKLIQILANNERDFSFGVDNNIVFVSRIPELMKVIE